MLIKKWVNHLVQMGLINQGKWLGELLLGEDELILAKKLIVASDFAFLGKMMVKMKVWVYIFCAETSILGVFIPIICHKCVVLPYYTCTKLDFNISFPLEINLEKITGD